MLSQTLILSFLLTLAPFQDVEVPIVQEAHSRSWCLVRLKEMGPVVSKEQFAEISSSDAAKNCGFLKNLKIDFDKQSLLTYRVQGDCFVRATAKLTRNDELKKYTLRITKIWGGCRAAGAFQDWLVVDKLREGYTVEQEVTQGKDF